MHYGPARTNRIKIFSDLKNTGLCFEGLYAIYISKSIVKVLAFIYCIIFKLLLYYNSRAWQ